MRRWYCSAPLPEMEAQIIVTTGVAGAWEEYRTTFRPHLPCLSFGSGTGLDWVARGYMLRLGRPNAPGSPGGPPGWGMEVCHGSGPFASASAAD